MKDNHKIVKMSLKAVEIAIHKPGTAKGRRNKAKIRRVNERRGRKPDPVG